MTGGDIVKWGLIGVAAWWVYETFFTTTTAAAASTAVAPAATPVVAAAPVPVAAPAPATPAATSNGGLNALYNSMVAAAQAANDPAVTNSGGVLSATGYVWNYYLTKVNPSVTPNMDALANGSTVYTSAAYWALVGPAIGTALGLSGYRLGLAGLGAAIMRGRR